MLLGAMRQRRMESDAGGIDVRLRNAACSDSVAVLGFVKSAQPGMTVLLEAMRQRRIESDAAVLMCDCEMRRAAIRWRCWGSEERTARNDCATGGDAAAAMQQRRIESDRRYRCATAKCGVQRFGGGAGVREERTARNDCATGGDAAAAMQQRRCGGGDAATAMRRRRIESDAGGMLPGRQSR